MAASNQPAAVHDNGINGDSWPGVEERISVSRFDALIATGYKALESNDLALAEHVAIIADELMPNASAVARLTRAIDAHAAQQLSIPIVRRTVAAVLLLATGVSLILVIDQSRTANASFDHPTPGRVTTDYPSASTLAVTDFSAALAPLMHPVSDMTVRVRVVDARTLSNAAGRGDDPLPRRAAP